MKRGSMLDNYVSGFKPSGAALHTVPQTGQEGLSMNRGLSNANLGNFSNRMMVGANAENYSNTMMNNANSGNYYSDRMIGNASSANFSSGMIGNAHTGGYSRQKDSTRTYIQPSGSRNDFPSERGDMDYHRAFSGDISSGIGSGVSSNRNKAYSGDESRRIGYNQSVSPSDMDNRGRASADIRFFNTDDYSRVYNNFNQQMDIQSRKLKEATERIENEIQQARQSVLQNSLSTSNPVKTDISRAMKNEMSKNRNMTAVLDTNRARAFENQVASATENILEQKIAKAFTNMMGGNPTQMSNFPSDQRGYRMTAPNVVDRRDYSPVRRDYPSRRRDYSPVRRDYSPQRRDYSPRRRDRTSAWRDRNPVRRDRTPVKRDRKLVRKDRTPLRSRPQQKRRGQPQSKKLASKNKSQVNQANQAKANQAGQAKANQVNQKRSGKLTWLQNKKRQMNYIRKQQQARRANKTSAGQRRGRPGKKTSNNKNINRGKADPESAFQLNQMKKKNKSRGNRGAKKSSYNCDLCRERFAVKAEYDKHINDHVPGNHSFVRLGKGPFQRFCAPCSHWCTEKSVLEHKNSARHIVTAEVMKNVEINKTPAEDPEGVEHIEPVDGFLCNLCHQFFTDDEFAHIIHCKGVAHQKNLMKHKFSKFTKADVEDYIRGLLEKKGMAYDDDQMKQILSEEVSEMDKTSEPRMINRTTVFIGNVKKNASPEKIWSLFKEIGIKIRYVRKKKGQRFAHVDLHRSEDLPEVLKKLKNYDYYGAKLNVNSSGSNQSSVQNGSPNKSVEENPEETMNTDE